MVKIREAMKEENNLIQKIENYDHSDWKSKKIQFKICVSKLKLK